MLSSPCYLLQYSQREIPAGYVTSGTLFSENQSFHQNLEQADFKSAGAQIEQWHRQFFATHISFTKDNYKDAAESLAHVIACAGSFKDIDRKKLYAVLFYDLLHSRQLIAPQCLLIKQMATKDLPVVFYLITLMSYPNILEQDSNQALRQFLMSESAAQLLQVVAKENMAFSFLNSVFTLFNKTPAIHFEDTLLVVQTLCTACSELTKDPIRVAITRLSDDVKQCIIDRIWLVSLLSPMDLNLYYSLPLVCCQEDSVLGKLPNRQLNAVRFEVARLGKQADPATYIRCMESLTAPMRQHLEHTLDVIIEQVPSVCCDLLFYQQRKPAPICSIGAAIR